MGFYSFKNFRQITNDEIRLILEWRNHDNIRKWMYHQDIIPLEKHIQFIENLKADDTKQYWLVKRKGMDIGVISIVNIENETGEFGYYLAPFLHQSDLSVEFYYNSLLFLFEKIKIEELYGYAIVTNKSANSLATLFKFEKKEIKKDIDGELIDFFHLKINRVKWINNLKNDCKIQRILKLTEN